MQGRVIAKVFVDKTVYHIDKAFDYLVPLNLQSTLSRGCRVIIPFGKGNKKIQGLVESICIQEERKIKLKPILSQIDKEPIVTEEMFSMINFLVKNTFCTYYDAVKTVLPAGTNVNVVEHYKVTSSLSLIEDINLSENEKRIIEFLKTAKTEKELSNFLDCKINPSKKPVVKSLLEKGFIEKTDKIQSKVAKKTIRMVKLCDGFEPEGVKLSLKQKEVINLLNDVKVAMVKELCYLCGVTEVVIKNLAKKHIIEYFEREVKTSYDEISFKKIDLSEIKLSKAQTSVYNGIINLVHQDKPSVSLLHGVTGSGKTQIYIKLIEQVLNEDKNAIMLVPEISLTPQLVNKFKILFGDIIAVVHSNLTLSERLTEFNKIKANQVRIVIGTRSAIFSPLEKIGIIILDEEGELSYKSESSPRYHARDIAKLRCVNHNATLVLGSATPSIDSYYNAKKGTYSLFTIDERYKNANLPNVYLIDMLEEQRHCNVSPISEVLAQQLLLNLQQGEQSILLINRRGYQSYATCMQCGEVITCPSCDVAMTYHKANGYLMCHYCGHTEKFNQSCPSCKGEFIKLTGVGTQKVEDELKFMFPNARILRMDTDTTYSRFSYEKNFSDFSKGKYDIMLGTQMIAKGLDFPNVTLVGVINADSGLYSSDFKSSERIFSLITQVVGRSGRSEKSGRAYIQTMDVNNPVINLAANQDYKSFYEDELVTRKVMTYPPFCDICMLGFSSSNENKAKNAALRAFQILKQEALKTKDIAIKVYGVAPANIYKISNKYRYRIIIKCKFNNKFKEFLSNVLIKCGNDKMIAGVSIFADINGDLNI